VTRQTMITRPGEARPDDHYLELAGRVMAASRNASDCVDFAERLDRLERNLLKARPGTGAETWRRALDLVAREAPWILASATRGPAPDHRPRHPAGKAERSKRPRLRVVKD
jgi:hypothetical protein